MHNASDESKDGQTTGTSRWLNWLVCMSQVDRNLSDEFPCSGVRLIHKSNQCNNKVHSEAHK